MVSPPPELNSSHKRLHKTQAACHSGAEGCAPQLCSLILQGSRAHPAAGACVPGEPPRALPREELKVLVGLHGGKLGASALKVPLCK